MTSKPWWRTDAYENEDPIAAGIYGHEGPHGIALVKAWPDGRTDRGWGLLGPKDDPDNGFIQRYPKNEFNARRVLFGYQRGLWTFAFIMRSLRLVCIDIDGKNGGIEHAKKLGMLPPTLAETSKSGDGYHLFYSTDEPWDDNLGFAKLGDRIGIEQGVDFRAVGCVYHYPQQRWNHRAPAPLPKHLQDQLLHREQKAASNHQRIVAVLESQDEMEILMMQDQIEADLAKPIPTGKRNITLFAIGNQMRYAQIPDWETKLGDRARQVGLDDIEIDKLIANIRTYGTKPTP